MKPIKHSKRRTVRLLRQLQEVLRGAPREKFDMLSWATDGFNIRAITKPVCATAACAAGWATVMPEMKRIGFHLVPAFDNKATIKLGDKEGFDAFAEAFGLSDEDTDSIAYPSTYTERPITPAMVITRIDEVIARL